MRGIYFLLPTLLVILISFLIVRATAIALMMTGMDSKRTLFKALSAFSGTGFTTKEAEFVMNHPTRIIITWLMILGNAGIVTVIVTMTSSFVTSRGYFLSINILILFIGIYLIYKLVTRRSFIRKWESFIENKLVKSSSFEEGVTEDLLHLIEGYGLVRVFITRSNPLIGSSISSNKFTERDVLVLGIERENKWIPIPKGKERIIEDDRLIIYGPLESLKTIFK